VQTLIEQPKPAKKGVHWMGVVAIGALWAGLINQLRVDWSINPQYAYGWGVPFLAAYLFWKRWEDRPEPQPVPVGAGQLLCFSFLLLCLAPIRLVQEANPDWRLVSWSYTIVAVGLTLQALAFAGGRPWARHFFIPVAFIILAVPWPSDLEQGFVQTLMRNVAAVTVETINWCGIPAIRKGNVIELASGAVGVNEACSGVRSFQSTLMASIFFGELYRLSAVRRGILIALGCVVALAFNLMRTFWLTWLSVQRGTDVLVSWHDPSGYFSMGSGFVALWLIVLWLKRGAPASEPLASAASAGRWLPRKLVLSALSWLVLVEIGTQLWYGLHEIGVERRVTWKMALPEATNEFRRLEIEEDVRALLRYNVGQSAVWSRDDGSQWLIYYLEWHPGRAAAQLARNHTPEICLPASGLKMVSDLGTQTVEVDGVELPVHAYVFESRGQVLYVFYCLWEDRPNVRNSRWAQDFSRLSRFRAVLEGRRHLGQRVLEVAISGAASETQARRDFERQLRQLIQVSRDNV
jgi:exosortase